MRIAAVVLPFLLLAGTFAEDFDIEYDGRSPLLDQLHLIEQRLAVQQQNDHNFIVKILSSAFEVFELKKIIDDLKNGRDSPGSCAACKFGISAFKHLLKWVKSRDKVASIGVKVCSSLHIETPRVCRGIIDMFKDELIKVVSSSQVTPSEFCAAMLGDSCDKSTDHDWTIPLTPYPKPPIDTSWVEPDPSAPKMRVLHITDIHIDEMYAEGTESKCGEPLCCRNNDAPAESPDTAAGYWGTVGLCDIPSRTVEASLKAISLKHAGKIDYVIWTGDIPPHDIWNQTKEGQTRMIRKVDGMIKKYFSNVPVFPVVGNHEAVPVNSFPPPFIVGTRSNDWLYQELEQSWSDWLPSDALRSVGKGAFYSVMVRPNLKLISLNTNYCSTMDWWLLLNSTDPAGQLQWLVKELQMAEMAGVKVHIIGHIPPGAKDCLQVWSRNYNRIINRFESTVTAQFFGHTHQDEFEIFYDEDAKDKKMSYRPNNIAYVGPCLTTFGGVNPGYRIYAVDGGYDGASYNVIDYETYYMNLTHANMEGSGWKPDFELSYRAKDSYNLENLSPSSWSHFVSGLLNNEAAFRKFYHNFFNLADNVKEADHDRKQELICRLITSKSHETEYCHQLMQSVL